MTKFVALWHRADEVVDFEERYRSGHVPIARALPGAVVETARVIGDGPWMWMTEIRFPSLDAATRALQSPAGDAARVDANAMALELGLTFDTFVADEITDHEVGTAADIVAAGDGQAYRFGDARMTIKARAATTGTSVIEMLLPAGGSSPLHVHHNLDDTFFILDGVLTVWLEGETYELRPGDYARLPRGVPHSVLAADGPVKALLLLATDEFGDFVEAVSTPVDGTSAPALSPDSIGAAARMYGQDVLGPSPL